MKHSFLALSIGLWTLASLAAPLELEQYPEERVYTSADRGYTQYGAPSLHGRSIYSLTFDDGPHEVHTPKLLDVLKKHQARATFFVITSRIGDKQIPLIKRMLDEGHLVVSHGESHDNSNNISKSDWKRRVKKSFLDLKKIYQKAGHEFKGFYYRFPYAAYGIRKDHHHMNTLKEISAELFGGNCIQFAFWDIDSGDWIPKMTSAEVTQNLISSHEGGRYIDYKTITRANGSKTQIKVPKTITKPLGGGVVLGHDVQGHTPQGIDQFLSYAAQNAISIVPLPEVEEFALKEGCQFKE